MTTIDRLKSVMPGQTVAWYSRIAAEIDAGRIPMPELEPSKPAAVDTTKPAAAVDTTKPAAVGTDYTVPILKAIGLGLLTSYFVVFVGNFVLVGTAVAAFTCADRLKAAAES